MAEAVDESSVAGFVGFVAAITYLDGGFMLDSAFAMANIEILSN